MLAIMRGGRSRPGSAVVVALGVLVTALAACGSGVPARPVPPPAPTAPAPASCAAVAGFSCEQSARFASAQRYVDERPGAPGFLAVVFTDRVTGARWTAGDVDRPGWTASTIKLAMAADVLERGEAGDADRADLDAMLHTSDNAAADRVWRRHGGEAMLERFRTRFSMPTVAFQPGFTTTPYWGFVKCSAADLAALARYVLTETSPPTRTYLVDAMRGVAENQHWGVWSAGADQRPGTKDGWSQEQDPWGEHWVATTVGFAGPDERYVVAVSYQMPAPGSLDGGVQAVSDVVALLFGRPVPTPVTLPEPD